MVLREDMLKDPQRKFQHCATVYLKPAPFYMDKNFLKMSHDKELTETAYLNQFRKPTDEKFMPIVRRYHPHLQDLTQSQIGEIESGKL